MKWNAVSMLLVLLSVSACATSGQGSYCDNASPIYLSRADVLTDQTELAVIKHNEKGVALCGWKGK
jgi:hypothetical protein